VERHLQFGAETHHFVFVHGRERRGNRDRVIEAKTERAAHGVEEGRGGIGKWIVGERPERNAANLARCRDNARLGQQHEVAAREVDVFVGRVVGRRRAADGPVRRGVDIAHVEVERGERRYARREDGIGEQVAQHLELASLPRKADADVDRMRTALLRLQSQKHGTVEAAGEKYEALGHNDKIMSSVDTLAIVDTLHQSPMYSVTKKIDFCYGHRLLDYDGICKHPHGHNATAEVEVRTDTLDNRNMVCDFSDIKRIVKGWIDRELDHKMILRHDDPLVKPLQQLGEPIFIVDSNPTVERIARLIFDHAREHGLPVVKVTVWETPTSFATFQDKPSAPLAL
jgi:6-pyruvoyltetrahydropterin/6-carboxytetrahydropterin synthase